MNFSSMKNVLLKTVKRFRQYVHRAISLCNADNRKLSQCSLICNNCIGGFIYSDLQLKFNSPTINLQIPPADFCKFINNIDKYLSYELEEVLPPPIEEFKKLGGENINFPVGKLGDILIFFQHYKNFESAKCKWEERKQRINRDRMHFILVDTFCSLEEMKTFLSCPGKKLLITSNPAAAAIAPDQTVFMKNKPDNKFWFENDPMDTLGLPYYKIFDYAAWMLDKDIQK